MNRFATLFPQGAQRTKKEVDDIKEANKIERRFLSVQNKVNNVVFIRTILDDPTELVNLIFEDILKSQVRKSKRCLRFLPVISTCYAKVDEIIKAAKPIIDQYFHQSTVPFSFCLMWKVRCNNTLSRDNVFPALVEYIDSGAVTHKTEYTNPEVILNMDIIGNICCFSILRNYTKYKKYNLDSLVKAEIQDGSNNSDIHKESNKVKDGVQEKGETNQIADEVSDKTEIVDNKGNVENKEDNDKISNKSNSTTDKIPEEKPETTTFDVKSEPTNEDLSKTSDGKSNLCESEKDST